MKRTITENTSSKQDKDLITIIVPVYNVEKYLRRCLDSVAHQTYEKLEIIIIDDGSTDESGRIADEYAKKYNTIKVVHKDNGGLSDARNTGIEKSHGKYLAFIDSDDYISPSFIDVLYKNLIKMEADMSICRFKKVTVGEKNDIAENGSDVTSVFSGNQKYEELYGEKGEYIVVAWNKLYKRELFNDIRYPVGKIHEDEFVIHNLLKKSKKIVFCDRILYYYVQRKNSIMSSAGTTSAVVLEAYEERLKLFKDEPYIYYLTLRFYIRGLALFYVKTRRMEKIHQEIKWKLRNSYSLIKTSKFLTKSAKIKVAVARYFPHVFYVVHALRMRRN